MDCLRIPSWIFRVVSLWVSSCNSLWFSSWVFPWISSWISERPETPLSVVIISIDSTSIELQITPSISDQSSIIHWIVEAERRHFSTDIPQWKEFSTSPGSASTLLLVSGFQPDAEYRLRVSAENVAGRSAASEPSDWFRTASAAPSSPPEKVALRPLNATAFVSTWTVGESTSCGYGICLVRTLTL